MGDRASGCWAPQIARAHPPHTPPGGVVRRYPDPGCLAAITGNAPPPFPRSGSGSGSGPGLGPGLGLRQVAALKQFGGQNRHKNRSCVQRTFFAPPWPHAWGEGGRVRATQCPHHTLRPKKSASRVVWWRGPSSPFFGRPIYDKQPVCGEMAMPATWQSDGFFWCPPRDPPLGKVFRAIQGR